MPLKSCLFDISYIGENIQSLFSVLNWELYFTKKIDVFSSALTILTNIQHNKYYVLHGGYAEKQIIMK